MYDKQVQVETIVASSLWIAGAALIAVAVVLHVMGMGPAGVALILFGGIVDLHGKFNDLERRERQAFEMGRRLTAIGERERHR